MDSRRRNKRVLIRRLVEGQDEIGQPVTTWANLIAAGDGKIAANIRFLRGLESIKAGAETATKQASINIAYRTDVTEAMRIEYGSTVFQIKSVLPDEQNREHVDLVAEVIA